MSHATLQPEGKYEFDIERATDNIRWLQRRRRIRDVIAFLLGGGFYAVLRVLVEWAMA